jgi:2-oxoglutarate ferredoxin oxidoreductase subunit gamma
MNNPALFQYQNQVQSGGTLFLNSSMIESRPARGDVEIIEVPANDLARKLNDDRVTNIVMLGAFIKKSALVSPDTVARVIKDTFASRNPGVLKLNKSALQLGYDYLR